MTIGMYVFFLVLFRCFGDPYHLSFEEEGPKPSQNQLSSIWKLFFMHVGSVQLMGLQTDIFYLKTIWWNPVDSVMKYYLSFETCFSVLLEYLLLNKPIALYTSSTSQGRWRKFQNRKPIGRVGCSDSRMAERIHWWTERWLELCFLEWLQWLQWSPHHNCWM